MQFYKGQKVEYFQSDVKKIYYGEVTKVFVGSNPPSTVAISVLWETGIEHHYRGTEAMLKLGKIKPVFSLPKNNPNRRFAEDEKKI